MARIGSKYIFSAVLMDFHLRGFNGSVVKVVPGPGVGRPPSRFAYIESESGAFLGMVCAASLQPRRKKSAMDIAADAAGLKKVKGALGGTYYE